MQKSNEKSLAMIQKRVAAKDPEAIFHLGDLYNHGGNGLEKNESRAIELWSEAADLGSIEALHFMGGVYYHGKGVKRDKSKGLRCWESAAMKGGVHSRHCLG